MPNCLCGWKTNTDLILVANEVVVEYKGKEKERLDFKAWSWEGFRPGELRFFMDVLHIKGFHDKWIQWMRGCVCDPKFSIFINESPKGRISTSRRLETRRSALLFSLYFGKWGFKQLHCTNRKEWANWMLCCGNGKWQSWSITTTINLQMIPFFVSMIKLG